MPRANLAQRLSLTDEISLADAFETYSREREQDHERENVEEQGQTFTIHTQAQPKWAELQQQHRTSTCNKIVSVLNLLLSAVLALSLALVAHSTSERCHRTLEKAVPYSPVLEAVVYESQRFLPEYIFQSETSDQVEAAWTRLQGASNGIVGLDPEESTKLAALSQKTIPLDPPQENYTWSVSMYQQLHCLDTIRKSFYREKFFPNFTDGEFNLQKSVFLPRVRLDSGIWKGLTDLDECIDFLRQTIQCHGDVTMVYVGSGRLNVTGMVGTEASSFLRKDDTVAADFWDGMHACRDPMSIENWVRRHPRPIS